MPDRHTPTYKQITMAELSQMAAVAQTGRYAFSRAPEAAARQSTSPAGLVRCFPGSTTPRLPRYRPVLSAYRLTSSLRVEVRETPDVA